MNSDKLALALLATVDGFSPKKRMAVLQALNGQPGILITDTDHALSLLDGTLTDKALIALKAAISQDKQQFLQRLDALNIDVLTILDSDYPECLMDIAEPPVVLFCIGDKNLLNGNNIAVIGSRYSTTAAIRHAETFAKSFAQGGLNVVSGLARGIDSTGQRASMGAGGKVIAVLGSGIDVVYPAESKELYDDICTRGLVVSEYAPGTPPHHYQFPERNRIISALSRAVVVIEAGEKSGALITANIAVEQGKDVFVLPSSVDCRSGRGGNAFIKEYPTSFITEPEDVFAALNMDAPITEKADMALSAMEERIVSALGNGPKHFDELLEISQLNSNNLNSLLAKLEISGIIIKLSGNEFSL